MDSGPVAVDESADDGLSWTRNTWLAWSNAMRSGEAGLELRRAEKLPLQLADRPADASKPSGCGIGTHG